MLKFVYITFAVLNTGRHSVIRGYHSLEAAKEYWRIESGIHVDEWEELPEPNRFMAHCIHSTIEKSCGIQRVPYMDETSE